MHSAVVRPIATGLHKTAKKPCKARNCADWKKDCGCGNIAQVLGISIKTTGGLLRLHCCISALME